MNNRIRYAAYVLLGVSIVLTLLLVYPEVNRSRAKARAVVPTADFRAGTTETVEEKVTLYPANRKTSGHLWHWVENHSYCGPPDYLPKRLFYPEDIPGTIVAGFKHYYDKGAIVFGCPEGSNAAFRGAVWFDLSDIMKKAPPLHIAVQNATLTFKVSGGCSQELLYGTADWMKGYPENTLVTGDHVATLGSCLPGMDSCSIDVPVETVVNNWLKGAVHGGYANDGFVFKAMQDADLRYENSDGCYSRYGDFSLTVDYKYDKEPIILVVLPKKPDIPVAKPGVSSPLGDSTALATRTNYALASNGGKAVSSTTLAPNVESYVNDGDRTGAGNKVWLDSTLGSFPDYIEIDLDGKKSIDEIDVITRQDNLTSPGEPSLSPPTVFKLYGITAYDVQYWDDGAWTTFASVGSVPPLNDQVWRKFTPIFPVITDKIRIQINGCADNAYSRVVEVEAWGK